MTHAPLPERSKKQAPCVLWYRYLRESSNSTHYSTSNGLETQSNVACRAVMRGTVHQIPCIVLVQYDATVQTDFQRSGFCLIFHSPLYSMYLPNINKRKTPHT